MSGSRFVRFEITLKLIAPVLTKAAGTVGLGIDAAMLRDPNGRPAFHFTHIKGKLREAWDHLYQCCGAPDPALVSRWLGDDSNDADWAPKRGELSFEAYWVARDTAGAGAHRYRVRIDEDTGAADDGALQVIECPWPAGAEVAFDGSIYARVDSDDEKLLQDWLLRGLNAITALGANKGNGFGRLVRVEVTLHDASATPPQLPTTLSATDRVGIRICPLDPFCFASPAVGPRNHFNAQIKVPGGAIIAAIARRRDLEPARFPALVEQLDSLVATQAHPVVAGAGNRPIALPISVVTTSRGFRDIVDWSVPGTVDDEAPLFAVDWKDDVRDACLARLNPQAAVPEKLLLIRTAIDPDTKTSAEDQLFSMETVCPGDHDWLANLDLSGCTDPAQVLEELRVLFAEPLTHLGKTKARALVKVEPPYPFSQTTVRHDAGTLRLYLQSSTALLLDGFRAPASGGQQSLHQAYDEAWRELSAGALSLAHFFAAQQLVGGEHWWRRGGFSGTYRPLLLTCAGSVFVLDVHDPKQAATIVDDWCRRGLPQRRDIRGGGDWRRNPWIAQNGYGEVLVDPDLGPALAGTGASRGEPE